MTRSAFSMKANVKGKIRVTIDIGEGKPYVFEETPFKVLERDNENVFLKLRSRKNLEYYVNKHYNSLRKRIEKDYLDWLDKPLVEFMNFLFEKNDPFYKDFLHKFGTKKFCKFELTDNSVFQQHGLYLYFMKGEIKYIGRCLDNFKERFNPGYGTITAKNCYKGGQSTNLHINSLMNRWGDSVKICLCPLVVPADEIKCLETKMIAKVDPEWNR